MSSHRPRITCHVLDTHSGRPAASIPVTLTLITPTDVPFAGFPRVWTGSTDEDGRVTRWRVPNEQTAPYPVDTAFEHLEGELVWQLGFEVAAYWAVKGVRPFFPEVEVRFATMESKGAGGDKGEHWHVPVLLGPFGYTTYRGS